MQTAAYCPVHTALNIIGGKWKMLIIHHLSHGPRRFNELQRLMADTSRRILTLQLRELEAAGLIHRHDYRTVPPKVEYSLTEFGRTLLPAIQSLHDRAATYQTRCNEILATHQTDADEQVNKPADL